MRPVVLLLISFIVEVLGHGHRSGTDQTGFQSNQNTNRRRMSSDETSIDGGSSSSAPGGQWRGSGKRNGSWSSIDNVGRQKWSRSNGDGSSGFDRMNGSRGWSSGTSNSGGWGSGGSGRQQSGGQRAGGSRATGTDDGQFQSFGGSSGSTSNQNPGDVQWTGSSSSSGRSSSNQERSQNERGGQSWGQQGNRARGRPSSHGN